MSKVMDLHVKLTRAVLEKYEGCPNLETAFLSKTHKILSALLDFDFIDSRKRTRKPPQEIDVKKRNLGPGPSEVKEKKDSCIDIISDESGDGDTSIIDLCAENLLVELNKSQEDIQPKLIETNGADVIIEDEDFEEAFSISQP